ncbi:MAG: hypothetical protein PHO86_06900 [Bacilli bacterium]|nr:hypothetical protein [Bacilli bacterium]
MSRYKWKKVAPYIIPFFAICLLIILLYLMLAVFKHDPERLVGDVLLISGVVSLIMTFTVSLSNAQIIEFVIYTIYKIRKMINPKLEKYNNPDSFRDFHNHISSDPYIITLPAYIMSLMVLVSGIIYLNYFI